jgi:hypothetical protein
MGLRDAWARIAGFSDPMGGEECKEGRELERDYKGDKIDQKCRLSRYHCSVCVRHNPVHILLTAAELVVWKIKTRKVWDGTAKTEMNHLRLNVIDDYNANMNGTDIADQLRGVYRPHH